MSQAVNWSILFYLLSIPMCRAGRDNAEPTELIPDLAVDSYGTSRMEMPNDRPHENIEMQQVFKFIEDKFLSFAALNLRPNFANIFRHMERMARAFVKLSARVDAMYIQIEEMKHNQQNHTQNIGEASLNSLKLTLDELDNKVDNIEKQIHLSSPQGLINELGHLRQQIFNLETRIDFGNEQSRKSPAEVNTLNVISKMDAKLYNIQRNLSEVISFQHENRNLIQNTALTIHNINHKLNHTNHRISEIIAVHQNTLSDNRETKRDTHHLSHLQKFSNLLYQFEVQQNKTDVLLQNCKKHPPMNYYPTESQQEKISELLDIVQDLPNLVTDAIDKVEIISDKLQDRLETGEKISQQCQRDVSSAVPKLHLIETNLERVLHQLQHKSDRKHSTTDGSIIQDMNQIHSLITKIEFTSDTLNNILNVKFPSFLESHNYNITEIHRLLNLILKSVSPSSRTADDSVTETGTMHNIHKLIMTNHFALGNQTQMIKTILKELINMETSSNVTLDKLEFITSFLSYFQVDQSNTAELIDTMTKNIQVLNYNKDDILNNIKEIRSDFNNYIIKRDNYLEPLEKNNETISAILDVLLKNEEFSSIQNVYNSGLHSGKKHDIDYNHIVQALTKWCKQDRENKSNIHIPQQKQRSILYQDNESSLPFSSKQIINSFDNLTVKMDHLLKLFNQINENLQQSTINQTSHNLVDKHPTTITNSDESLQFYDINENLQKLYNHSLFHESSTHKQFEQLIEILLSKIQLLMSQSTELQHIKDILNSFSSNKENSLIYASEGITTGITNELKEGIKDKFNDLQLHVQKTVDDALLGIVDVLGKNKMWFQQETTTFIKQQNDSISKLKTSTGTLVSKGFENLQFMYQYLNAKLDKIHQIAAHNLEDCADIQKSGHTVSGVYTIYPRNSKEIRVYCDMESNGVGWTVIQRRGNFGKTQRTSFNQSWVNYKYGFGNLEEEFWLGNENIHTISNQGNYVLRIDFVYMQPDKMLPRYKRKFWHDLKDTSKLYAQYTQFQMNDESSNYSIGYSAYTGIHPYDGFEGRIGLSFTTYDHYISPHDYYCAKVQGGGWWYGTECFRFALNSKYKNHYWDDRNLFTGITWGGPADVALLQEVEMKLLPHSIFQRLISDESKQFPL